MNQKQYQTCSFLVSLSRSSLDILLLTLRARERAISPAVLMSFSCRSNLTIRDVSAITSAKATAPEDKDCTWIINLRHKTAKSNIFDLLLYTRSNLHSNKMKYI